MTDHTPFVVSKAIEYLDKHSDDPNKDLTKKLIRFVKSSKAISVKKENLTGSINDFKLNAEQLNGDIDLLVKITLEESINELFNTSNTSFTKWVKNDSIPISVYMLIPDAKNFQMISEDNRTFRLLAPINSETSFRIIANINEDDQNKYRLKMEAGGYIYIK